MHHALPFLQQIGFRLARGEVGERIVVVDDFRDLATAALARILESAQLVHAELSGAPAAHDDVVRAPLVIELVFRMHQPSVHTPLRRVVFQEELHRPRSVPRLQRVFRARERRIRTGVRENIGIDAGRGDVAPDDEPIHHVAHVPSYFPGRVRCRGECEARPRTVEGRSEIDAGQTAKAILVERGEPGRLHPVGERMRRVRAAVEPADDVGRIVRREDETVGLCRIAPEVGVWRRAWRVGDLRRFADEADAAPLHHEVEIRRAAVKLQHAVTRLHKGTPRKRRPDGAMDGADRGGPARIHADLRAVVHAAEEEVVERPGVDVVDRAVVPLPLHPEVVPGDLGLGEGIRVDKRLRHADAARQPETGLHAHVPERDGRAVVRHTARDDGKRMAIAIAVVLVDFVLEGGAVLVEGPSKLQVVVARSHQAVSTCLDDHRARTTSPPFPKGDRALRAAPRRIFERHEDRAYVLVGTADIEARAHTQRRPFSGIVGIVHKRAAVVRRGAVGVGAEVKKRNAAHRLRPPDGTVPGVGPSRLPGRVGSRQADGVAVSVPRSVRVLPDG